MPMRPPTAEPAQDETIGGTQEPSRLGSTDKARVVAARFVGECTVFPQVRPHWVHHELRSTAMVRNEGQNVKQPLAYGRRVILATAVARAIEYVEPCRELVRAGDRRPSPAAKVPIGRS